MSGSRAPARLADERLEARLVEGARTVMNENQALQAASRCLYCWDAPCRKACPAGVDVGRFVWDLASGNLRGAARTVLRSNVFGLTCARVCPTPSLCAGSCVLEHAGQPPVDIPGLQLYAVERARAAGYDPFVRKPPTGKRVALVGAGPASLACAHALALEGHECTVLEARELAGGLATFALAPYKLTAGQALAEVDWVTRLAGIQVRTGVRVGVEPTLQSLVDNFDAVFLGVGLGADSPLELPGAELPGVVGALALVERLKLAPAREVRDLDGVTDAAVVGGGSTALDLAQELRRLGVPSVTLCYRRSEELMPGHGHELDEARRLGVHTRFLSVPVGFEPGPGGRVGSVRLARCELGEPGADGRPRVRTVEGGETSLPAQLVALAVGQAGPPPALAELPGLRLGPDGCVVTLDETGRTGHPKVFAGGDCVTGGRELVHAVAAGNRAAAAISALMGKG